MILRKKVFSHFSKMSSDDNENLRFLVFYSFIFAILKFRIIMLRIYFQPEMKEKKLQ